MNNNISNNVYIQNNTNASNYNANDEDIESLELAILLSKQDMEARALQIQANSAPLSAVIAQTVSNPQINNRQEESQRLLQAQPQLLPRAQDAFYEQVVNNSIKDEANRKTKFEQIDHGYQVKFEDDTEEAIRLSLMPFNQQVFDALTRRTELLRVLWDVVENGLAESAFKQQ
jgi:hypothetical protein